jgi:hypothetical protein
MALGKWTNEKLRDLFIAVAILPRSPGHPFYQVLNRLLAVAWLDVYVEELCEPLYKEGGRPGVPPGVFFRRRPAAGPLFTQGMPTRGLPSGYVRTAEPVGFLGANFLARCSGSGSAIRLAGCVLTLSSIPKLAVPLMCGRAEQLHGRLSPGRK